MIKRRFRQSLVACALIAILTGSLSFAALAQPQRPRYGVRPTTDGTWTLPEGTVISVRMDSTLSSKSAHIGDHFTAIVDVPVYANGATVIPSGATIEGHVTEVTPARRMARSGMIAVEFENLVLPDGTRVAIDGNLTSDDPEIRRQIDEENRISGHKERDTGVFVGSSGAVGAVLGGIAGGLKGAAVGGAIGAGVAIGSILLAKGEEAKVPSGTPFGVQLRRALVIHTSQASDPVATRGQDNDPYPSRRDPVASNGGYRRQSPDTQPNNPPAEDRQPVEDRSARQPVDPDPNNDPADAQPTRQPAEPPATRQPIGTSPSDASDRAPDHEANNTPATEPAAPAEPLPLSSTEMTRRAQVALRDEGYYEGEIGDQWSPRATESLKSYQREHKLSETGNLDEATAKSLGITNARSAGATRPASSAPVKRPEARPAGQDSLMANVLSATATRNGDGSIYVLINTQANTGGWRWYGEHAVNGDTLEVYAKAVRPTGMVTQALTRGKIELSVQDGVANVMRVVIHSAGTDQVISLGRGAAIANNNPNPAPTRSAPDDNLLSLARQIQNRAGDLLAEHKRQLGMSGDTGRSVYSDADVELLFALNSFANAANLYGGLIGSLRDSQSKRQATLDLARQARRTDRIIAVSTSRAASPLLPQWDLIRQDVLRVMRMFNITTGEIEN